MEETGMEKSLMEEKKPAGQPGPPAWFRNRQVMEGAFCEAFMEGRHLVYCDGCFFDENGRLADDGPLREEIFSEIKNYVAGNVAGKVSSILETLKIVCRVKDFAPLDEFIQVENGMVFEDGTFVEANDFMPVQSRFPVRYNPGAAHPQKWLDFLHELLDPEDIITLQEYIGYCFLPTNKAQRMMIIKGKGGEGKSVIGAVLRDLFGVNAKDGSITKISENRFARADLEYIHLLIDDDMDMEALRKTNYIKSLVTAQGKMDLEKKGKQSYQGYVFARFLGFSNGSLQALYDKSDGFYRRQLVLTTLDRRKDRKDDPCLASKLIAEREGIFRWAMEGLQRLRMNGWRFSESQKSRTARLLAQVDDNNFIAFLRSQGYIRLDPEYSISSRELYGIYTLWCEENAVAPIKPRSMSEYLLSHLADYGLKYDFNCINSAGRRVRGFKGIDAVIRSRAG